MSGGYETVDRIRRSWRSAKPNPAVNPAWANAHMDVGILLTEIEQLCKALEMIRDGEIPQAMSPALFAEFILRGPLPQTCALCNGSKLVNQIEPNQQPVPCPKCSCL